MRESVLLINFQDKKKRKEIQMMLAAVGLRMRIVEKSEYSDSIGYLAGIKGMSPSDVPYEGGELEKEMMVFAGLTEDHLNQMLYLMRKSGIVPVDYKAVLTETNRGWRVPELYGELAKEHEAMTKK